MVRKLIEKGASLYTAQNQGKTPVEIARNKGMAYLKLDKYTFKLAKCIDFLLRLRRDC